MIGYIFKGKLQNLCSTIRRTILTENANNIEAESDHNTQAVNVAKSASDINQSVAELALGPIKSPGSQGQANSSRDRLNQVTSTSSLKPTHNSIDKAAPDINKSDLPGAKESGTQAGGIISVASWVRANQVSEAKAVTSSSALTNGKIAVTQAEYDSQCAKVSSLKQQLQTSRVSININFLRS